MNSPKSKSINNNFLNYWSVFLTTDFCLLYGKSNTSAKPLYSKLVREKVFKEAKCKLKEVKVQFF